MTPRSETLTTPESHRFTAGAYRAAADQWAGSDSAPHRDFAPTLRTWADRAEARAETALSEHPDQLELFNV